MVVNSVIAVIAAMIWAVTARETTSAPKPPPTTPSALLPIHRHGRPKLTIFAPEGGWIRLKVDGTLRFEGRMPQGSRQHWEGETTFSLRVAESDSIRISLDGTEIPPEDWVHSPDGWITIRRS